LSNGSGTFEDVWQTVRDRFYDPHLNGLDWSAVRERYGADAAQATSDKRLAEVINDMLSELHLRTPAITPRTSRSIISLPVSLPERCGGAGWTAPSQASGYPIPALASCRAPAYQVAA
jgi:hypothetical protein